MRVPPPLPVPMERGLERELSGARLARAPSGGCGEPPRSERSQEFKENAGAAGGGKSYLLATESSRKKEAGHGGGAVSSRPPSAGPSAAIPENAELRAASAAGCGGGVSPAGAAARRAERAGSGSGSGLPKNNGCIRPPSPPRVRA